MPLISDPALLEDLLLWLVLGSHAFLGTATVGHALLYKRDSRAALAWIAFALLFPLVGALMYALFGINRVETRARRMSGNPDYSALVDVDRGDADADVGMGAANSIAVVGERVTGNRASRGNRVDMLVNGEQAYPAMLDAMAGAEQCIWLTTYIFDTDDSGRRFIELLAERRRAGVDVRVLVDGMGALYSWPQAGKLLKEAGVPMARFLPPTLAPPTLRLNLRTHRKILVVDNRVAFAGGMNIGDRHLVAGTDNPDRVVDLHFALRGPVVQDLAALFLQDWRFCTGQDPEQPPPVPTTSQGEARCRVLADGPNEDLDRITMTAVGAIGAARERVRVMTPYFLPPPQLSGALIGAALRGVEVDVVLPGKNNLPYVQWASQHRLWELLQWGVRVWYQPPPFVHSKLLLVDNHYALIGSANLDPRSLRLNFEVGVEVFDETLGADLADYFDSAREGSRELHLKELLGRPVWQRLRDGAAGLAAPYL